MPTISQSRERYLPARWVGWRPVLVRSWEEEVVLVEVLARRKDEDWVGRREVETGVSL